jgi:flagella basal body P-ring formation protein FlgA
VGDEVRVRVARTGVLVTARVIDAQTVEVSP